MLRAWVLMDADAAVFSRKQKILYAILTFFFLATYAPGISWLYNVAMWVLFVYSFFYNSLREKIRLLRQRPALLLIMVFFLLNCVSALFSNNLAEGISWVGIRISLLVFPLAIGSVFIEQQLKERIILSYSLAASIAAAGSLCWGIWRAMHSGDASLLYNDNLSGVLNLQSVYFALLINLAVFGYAFLLFNKPAWCRPVVLLPVIALLLLVHFLLASRIAIIFLYGSMLAYAIYLVISKKKWKQGIVLALLLATAGFTLLHFFPKTINRFKELGYTQFNYKSQARESHFNMQLTPEQWNGANIRLAVWQCAWAVTKQHLWLGTGVGDKMDELKKQYAQKGFEFGIATNRNVHNNYLDVWMTMGLAGFILYLLGFFILPGRQCIQMADWYGLIIIASFAFSLFSETYMDRTVGNTFLSFFLAFISSYKKPPRLRAY